MDDKMLEQESTVLLEVGKTVYLDVFFYLKPSNPQFDAPTLNFSSDLIEASLLSQEPLEGSVPGYKSRYAIKGISEGETAFVFFAHNISGRIWINVAKDFTNEELHFGDSAEQPIYYDLQGNIIRTDKIKSGIYIKKTGHQYEKVLIKSGTSFQ